MRRLVIILFLIGSFQGFGQTINFIEPIHDFGEIKEEAGRAVHTFYFVNDLQDSIKIRGVRTSCGCTTPNWTKEYIFPGDSGFVIASFNPFNRPGNFNKSLRVTMSDGSSKTLYIRGKVLPRPRDITDELPTKIGSLRMRYKSLNMGKIKTDTSYTRVFPIYNEGNNPIELIKEKSKFPQHIDVNLVPPVIEPSKRGNIEVYYDPTVYSELGYTRSIVSLFTNDSISPVKQLQVFATVEEYFPPMTEEELQSAPRLVFNQKEYDFGLIREDTVTTEFLLSNAGRKNLNIRAVKSNCTCIDVEVNQKDILPGEESVLKVLFKSDKRRGRQYKTVTVFSNDPVSPTQVLSIRGDIRN